MKGILTLLSWLSAGALLLAGPLPFAAAPAAAQSPIRYQIDFENRAHHEGRVTIQLADLEPGPVELRMSRTSPGRYALHEFAKNVYDFSARTPDGRALPVERPDPHQWNVTGHDGEVVIEYTLFGDRADGTYTGIDRTHAHLNIPATFMYARSLAGRPIEVRFRVPEASGWRVATQLVPTGRPELFTAPDFAYFMDSPVELSAFELREWTVPGPSGPQTIRAAIHSQDDDAAVDRWASAARRIAAEEAAVFGGYPAFDHGVYTFLACYLPWAAGDGMEHRNSTVLTSTGSLERNLVGLLGTVAHELFHAWSMERIRAAALEPFDFEEAVMSGELWFGEGFTSYYDDLALVRSGLIAEEEYARRIGALVDVVVNGEGRELFSPVEMSMQAPFVDAAVSVDPTNRVNTFISYYDYGAFLGLALDLTLRGRSPGVTLDDFMRGMWERHGRTGVTYTIDDLERMLAEVTGDRELARGFFQRYVRGGEVPDMKTLLAQAGLRLHPANPEMPILTRARLTLTEAGLRVDGNTVRGDPLYQAGVDRGDVVVSVAEQPINEVGGLERALDRIPAGRSIEVEWESRGERYRALVTLQEHPALAVTPEEILADGRLAPVQRAFRERWLGSRAAEVAR